MHAFGHIEIPTTNIIKSKKFFGTVFGWTFSHIQDMRPLKLLMKDINICWDRVSQN